MLQVSIETTYGKEHEFYFNGDIMQLNNILGSSPVPCCDSMGNPTNTSKVFNNATMSVITLTEVEPTTKHVFNQVNVDNINAAPKQKSSPLNGATAEMYYSK